MEQSLPPQFGSLTVGTITTTSANVTTTVLPQGAATSFAVQFRPAGGSFWTSMTPETVSSDLFGTRPVSATLGGLNPDQSYEVRVAGGNVRGMTSGPVQTLRTAAEPVPAVTVSGLRATVTKRKALLRSTATTTVPGMLTQTATTGSRTVCRTPAREVPAGRANLTCTLSKKVRKLLRSKKVPLTVTTALMPRSGATVSTTSRLMVKRPR